MVKKITKKTKSVSRTVNAKSKITPKTTGYDYNEEFHLLDSLIFKTKRIKFQQWMYSLLLLILFLPLVVSVNNYTYLTVAITCLFGLFFSVYIAQSNRILVLLTQIKYTLENNKK
ncbi:MAG: hypothetical protein IJ638_04285 [Alphaproteobacteria bacterium]|nr:hypothetical protein [Alphaproteobacteria bacterium]